MKPATSMARIALLGLASMLCSCAALTEAVTMTVAGTATEIMVRGHQAPTVIFEAGLGDGIDSWSKIIGPVSQFATAVAYNRAGYGAAPRSDKPRTGVQIVEDLRALLKRQALAPPYVLVGHSLGGTFMELFARLHPEEVVGLVLVESRAASMTRRCREAHLWACDPPKFLVAAMPGAASAEYAVSDETFEQLLQAGPLPAVPLIVLTSARPQLAEGPALTALWQKTQQELATQSPLGQQRTTHGSGHYIQKDEPELVIDAVREVVSTVSRR